MIPDKTFIDATTASMVELVAMAWKLSARIIGEQERQRWNQSLGASVFALDWWLDLWPSEWGILQPIGLFSGDELIGGILLAERHRWGQKILETHPMVPYAGFWLVEPEGASRSKLESLYASSLEALDNFLSTQCGKVIIRFDPRFIDVRMLTQRGWHVSILYTYCIDLQRPDDFENDTRRQIESAKRNGITVERETDWAGFEKLAQHTHERKALNENYPANFLKRLGAALEESDSGSLYMAKSPDGEPLAGAIVTTVGDRAIYLYGGSSPSAAGTGAPSLLQGEIIRSLAEEGRCATYDLHGANTPSVIRFKKNFNPRLEQRLVCRRTYGLTSTLIHSVRDGFAQWRMGNEKEG